MNLAQFALYCVSVGILALLFRLDSGWFYVAICVGLIHCIKDIFKGE